MFKGNVLVMQPNYQNQYPCAVHSNSVNSPSIGRLFKSNETLFCFIFVRFVVCTECVSNLKQENMTDAELMNQRIVTIY